MSRPILCLDFDGVIHSYTSGWKGAAIIPDPPVPGAMEFIVRALLEFDVCIYSSRSHQWGGRRAMRRWLRKHLMELAADHDSTPKWLSDYVYRRAFADPWADEVDHAVSTIVRAVKWPLFKPSAMASIDDRGLTFNGTWPTIDSLLAFKPWNKKGTS